MRLELELRDEPPIAAVVCAWCGRLMRGELPAPPGAAISHGMCESCRKGEEKYAEADNT